MGVAIKNKHLGRGFGAKSWQLLIGGSVLVALFFGVLFQGFDQVVFFYTPQEILSEPKNFYDRQIRMGALVRKGSTHWNPHALELHFDVTEDSKHYLPVVFRGIKPDLYREGQGVVVEGMLSQNHVFYAHVLLVKHSEEYTIDENKVKNKEAFYRSLSPSSPSKNSPQPQKPF